MKLSHRPYQHEDDYWRIRSFLREVYLHNGRRGAVWQPYRLDYWRRHVNTNIYEMRLEEVIDLWETADGQIAAVLNPETKNEAYFQVHPAFRTPELEAEMLAVAEERLGKTAEAGHNKLTVWAPAGDVLRQTLFARNGYSRVEWAEAHRYRPINGPVAPAPLPPGYSLRALAEDELPARSWLSWIVFHPDEPDEKYEGWEWYRNVQLAALYRRDLDLVAVAPEGELAAFCTVWFDDVTRTGAFEPVGTSPAHQRRGLGKAILAEGLRRLQRLGANWATVGSYTVGAGALYEAAGFTNYDLSELWLKEW